MDHEVYKEMLALDALGALDGDDHSALSAHLADCPECRAEADALGDVASMLARTTVPVAPPVELRARVLDQIRSVKNVGVPGTQTGGTETTTTTTARAIGSTAETSHASEGEGAHEKTSSVARDSGSSKVLPFEPGRERRQIVISKSVFTFGAIAASLAIVALVASLATVWRRNNTLRAEMTRLVARSDELAARSTEAEQELARAREVTELLAAPGSRVMPLAGTKDAPGAHAAVAYNPQTGRAMLVAYDLPPAPAGKAYQLWFIAGKRAPMPGKVFRTDASGRGMLRDQMPLEASTPDAFAVTLEPEQGVPVATGAIYLLGKSS